MILLDKGKTSHSVDVIIDLIVSYTSKVTLLPMDDKMPIRT